MQADSPTRPDGGEAGEDTSPEARPMPDGPGPHDVPDDQVIDKTLPQKSPGAGERPD